MCMDKFLTLYTTIIAKSNEVADEDLLTAERAAIVAEGLVDDYGTPELWERLFRQTCLYLETVRVGRKFYYGG